MVHRPQFPHSHNAEPDSRTRQDASPSPETKHRMRRLQVRQVIGIVISRTDCELALQNQESEVQSVGRARESMTSCFLSCFNLCLFVAVL